VSTQRTVSFPRRRREPDLPPATLAGREDPRHRALLALQAGAGNQAVSALLARVSYAGTGREQGGAVDVTVAGQTIAAAGTVMRGEEGAAKAAVRVTGLLEFHDDDSEPNRVVIGNIRSQPKRTGVGMVLVYHLARDAKSRGKTVLGTDLSALEEGTPEFYMSLGLQPSHHHVNMALEATADMPTTNTAEIQARETQRKNIMYSARLDNSVDDVMARAYESMGRTWTAGSVGQRLANWFSTPSRK
jgi:hypothetical protein